VKEAAATGAGEAEAAAAAAGKAEAAVAAAAGARGSSSRGRGRGGGGGGRGRGGRYGSHGRARVSDGRVEVAAYLQVWLEEVASPLAVDGRASALTTSRCHCSSSPTHVSSSRLASTMSASSICDFCSNFGQIL
jgi:membrane protein involved in colicin uptake